MPRPVAMSHVHATAAKSTKNVVEDDSIADSEPSCNKTPFLFVRIMSPERQEDCYLLRRAC
jgi:hypothetical protein